MNSHGDTETQRKGQRDNEIQCPSVSLFLFLSCLCGSVAIMAKNKGATVVGLPVAPDIMAVIFLTSTTA
jgi:hypothetical protein